MLYSLLTTSFQGTCLFTDYPIHWCEQNPYFTFKQSGHSPRLPGAHKDVLCSFKYDFPIASASSGGPLMGSIPIMQFTDSTKQLLMYKSVKRWYMHSKSIVDYRLDSLLALLFYKRQSIKGQNSFGLEKPGLFKIHKQKQKF